LAARQPFGAIGGEVRRHERPTARQAPLMPMPLDIR
jgi:hypothetical protein